ncbi:hypothetical protein [Heyndrickxia oleronia]|uniref:hypothetical protein n=1 Tax=Heyndrickxia oleronia TaxID=38875 RepID=UPI00242F9066|nr:hypothetical protein [Heyndrickxia oleronia]MCI1592509.1 hypothetical protein [Heyndrickxia oleronia]MCI1615389.1 hypothetical protein [Heyndrickxia oleronia]MCI1746213.1 hypothetical protein [Heyndrickxia oleronia]MCI1763679.1 hypothetical protein [Heyndrickxia oleronia]
MDNYRNSSYSKEKKKENGVIRLTPTTTIKQSTGKAEALRRSAFSKKKRKSAREVQDEIGIYGAFGRTLVDLHKQGR